MMKDGGLSSRGVFDVSLWVVSLAAILQSVDLFTLSIGYNTKGKLLLHIADLSAELVMDIIIF